jgi:hypothetical protein
VPYHENRWKVQMQNVNDVIFFAQDQNFSKIHKSDKKISWPKPKILFDKLNCQILTISMNPRSILLTILTPRERLILKKK